MQGKSSKSITYLLAILHAAHTARCSTLHPHRISLRTRRTIALSRIGASLLGPRPCGRPLLLLGVGVGPSIWLPTHLPYLVHRAWRLEDTEKECLNELKQWMDGLENLPSKLKGEGLTWEIIVCNSLTVLGLMVMMCLLSLLDSVVTNSNKFYNDATDCSDSTNATGKRGEKLEKALLSTEQKWTKTLSLQCVVPASSHKPVRV